MDFSQQDQQNNIENLTDDQLLKLYEEFEKKVSMMELENSVFESHLNRVNPTALKGENENDPANGGKDANNMGGGSNTGKDNLRRDERLKKKRGDKAKENEVVILLTPEQKAEVANREVEEMKDEIEREKERWEKVTDNHKAEMEEIEIRINEYKKMTMDFRKVLPLVKNPRTGKVIAEKIIRYCEDSIKAKDTIIEKIRLKNSTLKVQKNKLQTQLRQKEEMGEVLHAIDFDQLKIENQQYLAKIDERNSELLKLKMSAGNTNQVLNYYKKRLNMFTSESEKLKNEIKQREDLMVKLEMEIGQVQSSLGHAEKVHTSLKLQTEEFKVPEVMEYVVEKALENDLKKQGRNWQRKVDVAKMGLRREKKILTSLLREEKALMNDHEIAVFGQIQGI